MPRRATQVSAANRLGATDVPTKSPPATAAAVSLIESPLDYMLRIMRDPNEDAERRDGMAKAALPYMHARLSNVDGRASDGEGGTITFTWQPPQE